MKRAGSSLSPVALLVLAACAENGVDGLAARPGADAGSASIDAGEAEDAGAEDLGARDLGPPARTLVRFRPLGDLPADNLVLNPLLDTTSAVAPVLGDGSQPRRSVRLDTPTKTPALRIASRTPVLLFVQARPPPLEASVWIGTPVDAEDPRVAVSGFDGTTFSGGDLEPDPETDRVVGELRWRQHRGTIAARLLGHAILFVSVTTPGTEIAGPVVRALPASFEGTPRPAPTRAFALSAAEETVLARAIRAWQLEHGRNLALPPTTVAPDRWPGLPGDGSRPAPIRPTASPWPTPTGERSPSSP